MDLVHKLSQKKRASSSFDSTSQTESADSNLSESLCYTSKFNSEDLEQAIRTKALAIRSHFDKIAVCKSALYVLAASLRADLLQASKNIAYNLLSMTVTCLGNSVNEKAVLQIQTGRF